MNETAPSEPDIVDRAFSGFDRVINEVHDRVIRPITLVARTLAFSAVIAVLAITATAVLLILVIRLLDVYLFSHHEWLTDLLLGAIFFSSGLLLWRRRTRK
ncbi:MAG: hypothetical protein WCG86_02285 [Actinomycetota bacterium]